MNLVVNLLKKYGSSKAKLECHLRHIIHQIYLGEHIPFKKY